MDPLTALLDAPRAHGAFLLRVTMSPPWGVRIRDEAPLAIVALTSGTAHYVPDRGDPVELGAGDVLVIADTTPYLFADSPTRTPQAVIHPGERCETPAGASLEIPTHHGIRTWGNSGTGRDVMLVGSYLNVSEAESRLLTSLPPTLVMRRGDHRSGLIDVLADEIQRDDLGQASLLDRLLDGLTVTAIRNWAKSADAMPPGWLRAGADPVVGAALELIHDRFAHPWTVGSLAREVGMSRAGFSRRFTNAVGEPPTTYLTSWRLAVAADRLRRDDAAISRIAADVGYASPFTFSTAFKRHYGVGPLAYRRHAAEPVPADG